MRLEHLYSLSSSRASTSPVRTLCPWYYWTHVKVGLQNCDLGQALPPQISKPAFTLVSQLECLSPLGYRIVQDAEEPEKNLTLSVMMIIALEGRL